MKIEIEGDIPEPQKGQLIQACLVIRREVSGIESGGLKNRTGSMIGHLAVRQVGDVDEEGKWKRSGKLEKVFSSALLGVASWGAKAIGVLNEREVKRTVDQSVKAAQTADRIFGELESEGTEYRVVEHRLLKKSRPR